MVKKHAATRKAAPKAQAGKKTKAKSVSAPKTYSPKGAPKEKLAYLNKAEMAALSKRNGGGPARGPKGIPSFVETSGTKSAKSISGGYKGGSGGWNSSSGSRSGNKSGVGGGGGGGGGATGSRGSSTGSVGARSGSNAPGNKGGARSPMGGQGGYNSGTSGSRFGGASTQAPGMGRNSGRVGPVSPMSGQGASFATPKAAKDYNRTTGMGIEDRSRMTRPFSREMEEDDYYNRQLDDLRKDTLRTDRTIAGVFAEPTRNAGEYAAKMANAARRTAERRAAANELAERNYNIRSENLDRMQMPMRDTRAIGKGFMENVGNQRLPSYGGGITSVRSVAGGKESRGGRGMKAGGQAKRTFKNK